MELKGNCIALLEKTTHKVKCYRFMNSDLNRELALHEDTDNNSHSSVTDVNTGLRLFGIPQRPKDVKEETLKEHMEKFLRHYTVENVLKKLAEADKTSMEEKFKKKVK